MSGTTGTTGGGPAGVGGRVPVLLAALAIAVIAFVFRFNALGGALGGFDNDHFIYLVRTDALLDGEQPLRDFVDAELRGAWPALSYSVSAWAQRIAGRTLLPEAYLTVGILALLHALVFVLALALARRWSIALLATAVTITTVPKLYNYPKVLVLTLTAWSMLALVRDPSIWRLVVAALITVAGVLFRHDLGIYAAAGILTALLVRDTTRWRQSVRTAAIYVALVVLLLLPSVAWVWTYEGLSQYVRDAAASVAVEQTRTNLTLPPFDVSELFSLPNLEIVTYYAFWAVPLTAALALGARFLRRRDVALTSHESAIALGLIAVAVLANASFLRANLAERFGDSAVAVALLAACVTGLAARAEPAMARGVLTAVPLALLLVIVSASYSFSDVRHELSTSGLSESPGRVLTRYRTVSGELAGAPPLVWTDDLAQGTLRAARFLAECTRPDARVLAIGPVHEALVFSRRKFAAGQAMFKLSLYTSEEQQRRALSRLEHQNVPIVLVDAAEFDEFTELYPLVAAHVTSMYRDVGAIDIEGEPRFRVLAAGGLAPVRTDPETGLPCYR